MGELEPVNSGEVEPGADAEFGTVGPETAESGPGALFTRSLRALFGSLDVSQNRYAARVYLDKSVLSRYLNGERIPRWDFVHRLLVESTMKNDGMAPTPAVVKHLRDQYYAALEAGGSPAHKIQLLQEQLADADAQAQRADRREREADQELHEAERRVAEFEVRVRELEDSVDRERDDHAAALVALQGDADAQRSMLLAEIERLTRELEVAQERRREAEARCEELERQLEQASEEEEQEPVPRGADAGAGSADFDDGQWLSQMSAESAANELHKMKAARAQVALDAMLTSRIMQIVEAGSPVQAGRLLGMLRPARASDIVRLMPTESMAAVARHIPLPQLTSIAQRMPVNTIEVLFREMRAEDGGTPSQDAYLALLNLLFDEMPENLREEVSRELGFSRYGPWDVQESRAVEM
ncbi:hypothetical protein [Catenulispora subtropica]|uniref:Flagellar motor switch protein FliG n=1 Tax=Catenulispora subtropica TaxID=450798 RepID=A0ABN2RC91_9ACTN